MIHGLSLLFLMLLLIVGPASAGTKKTPPAVSPYIPTEQDLQRYRKPPYQATPLTPEQRADVSTPSSTRIGSSGTIMPEALTYYCAGQAGIPLHGTVSSSQMILLSGCMDQQKHRLRAK